MSHKTLQLGMPKFGQSKKLPDQLQNIPSPTKCALPHTKIQTTHVRTVRISGDGAIFFFFFCKDDVGLRLRKWYHYVEKEDNAYANRWGSGKTVPVFIIIFFLFVVIFIIIIICLFVCFAFCNGGVICWYAPQEMVLLCQSQLSIDVLVSPFTLSGPSLLGM